MPKPVLPPLRAAYSPAKELLPKYLSDVLSRLETHEGYAIIKGSGPCRLGPSVVNDACPIATALRCRVGGIVIKPVKIVNGRVEGKGIDDIDSLTMGMAVHEKYIELVSQANPGWAIQADVFYTTFIEYNGELIEVGFSPDILIGRNNEWYLVEVKTAPPHTSHEVQLALYWYLLRDYYDIKRLYLVTPSAIIGYKPESMELYAKQGLDYLLAAKRVIDSWPRDAEKPGFIVKGTCPCKFAPVCPIYKGVLAYARES